MMHRKGKKRTGIKLTAFLLVLPLLLTGCWNNRDLNEINIVAGMGVERTEGGKILLTVQVVEPAAIQSTSSGKGKGGSSQPKPVFVESCEGETVFEAVRGMLSVIDKKLFLSTAQILIIGENLSRDGIGEILDFFQRDHEIDYSMEVLVANGATPREILEVETDMDAIPAVYIKGTVENTISRGTVKKTMLIDLIKDMGSRGRQLAIGQISKTGENEIRTEGTAVFKNGKLVGWLGPYETRGYLFATNKVKSAIVNVPADKGKIAMEIMRSKGKINVTFKNGKPAALTVKVKVYANVGGYEGRGKLDPDHLIKLEQSLAEEVKKEILMALEKSQKQYSSDIFGFGTNVHKYHPMYWKNAEKNWDVIFSMLPADVRVDARIMRTGISKSPVKKDE